MSSPRRRCRSSRASPEFAERQARTLAGSRILAERLTRADVAATGVKVLTGGTDVHLVLVRPARLGAGRQAGEDLLHEIGITVNRQTPCPSTRRPPMVTSGLRHRHPALATRGFTERTSPEVSDVIAAALNRSRTSAR